MAIPTKPEMLLQDVRKAVREYLVGYSVLDEISGLFKEAGIPCDSAFEPQVSGRRRTLVEQHFKMLDFSDDSDLRRFWVFTAKAIRHARKRNAEEFQKLRRLVQEAGFIYSNGELQRGQNTITEVTRRRILTGFPRNWWGDLNEVEFLERLYDLDNLPSSDSRFTYSPSAREDILQHCIRNVDWSADWVFTDPRFDLLNGSDEEFLRFLSETLHPVVRSDQKAVSEIVGFVNRHLEVDGWGLYPSHSISGCPVYSGRKRDHGLAHSVRSLKAVTSPLGSDYVARQITRMESAVADDPELAIGTAKEFVETICKTILSERGVEVSKNDDLPKIVRLTLKELKLTPDDIPDSAKSAETIKTLLMNLATVTKGLVEVRNAYGSGHGKSAASKGLQPRHARLSVGAATALGLFIYETFQTKDEVPA